MELHVVCIQDLGTLCLLSLPIHKEVITLQGHSLMRMAPELTWGKVASFLPSF